MVVVVTVVVAVKCTDVAVVVVVSSSSSSPVSFLIEGSESSPGPLDPRPSGVWGLDQEPRDGKLATVLTQTAPKPLTTSLKSSTTKNDPSKRTQTQVRTEAVTTGVLHVGLLGDAAPKLDRSLLEAPECALSLSISLSLSLSPSLSCPSLRASLLERDVVYSRVSYIDNTCVPAQRPCR